MTKKENTIVQSGKGFLFLDSSVKVMDKLPVGTYHVTFNPMSGFGLEKRESPFTLPEGYKTFGNREAKVKMVTDVYKSSDKNIGVMLTGAKGIGKTLFARMVATATQKELDMPTIIVDTTSGANNSGPLSEFIETLPGDILVMFDEFEKLADKEDQQGFLGLFDGMTNTKRMYMITANEERKLNDYLLGRPGRFFFSFKFSSLSPEETLEYVGHFISDLTKNDKRYLEELSRLFYLNYDKLNALVKMYKAGYSFYDGVQNINLQLTSTEYGSGIYKDSLVHIEITDESTGEKVYDSTFENRINLLGVTSTQGSSVDFDLRDENKVFDSYSWVTAEGFVLDAKSGAYVSTNVSIELSKDDDYKGYKFFKDKTPLVGTVTIKPKANTVTNSTLANISKAYGYSDELL